MLGELYALLAALAYGLAGVSIVMGKKTARGDNGVFLAIVVTALVSGTIWLGWGTVSLHDFAANDAVFALFVFAAAGVSSTVLGRITLYRATEQIGAIRTGLLRRLTPIFAMPLAFALVGQLPQLQEILGGSIIMAGVLLYLYSPKTSWSGVVVTGFRLGVASAFFYALSYALRSWGLERLPDPALGTLIGALVGCLWFPMVAAMSPNASSCFYRLLADRGTWQWITATALSIGQFMQFLALQSTTVLSVSVLGSLDVLFTAALIFVLRSGEIFMFRRLLVASFLALVGTIMIFAH